MSGDERPGFLSRWSRRKRGEREEERSAPEAPPLAAAPIVPLQDQATLQAEPPQPQAVEPPPTLDDVAALAPGDEIARFVAQGVDEGVRRAAFKKLFADPHFNIMDGLDTYIDDYTKSDPIPTAMLRQMHQSKLLGLFADEEEQPPQEAATTVAAADPPVSTVPHEDPDLQLQPDHAARPGGAEDGAGEHEPRPERG